MGKVVLFALFILLSCQQESKKDYTLGSEVVPKAEATISSSEKAKIDKFFAEMGIMDITRNRNFTDSIGHDLDMRARTFIENHKNDNSNPKRTAIDRVTRLLLFDFGLLKSDKFEDKITRDFYVLEFLKNGSPEPLHLFEILKYAKKENLVSEDKIKRITWYLDHNIETIKSQYLKTIEFHKLEIKKNQMFNEMFSAENEILTAKIKAFEQIANDIKDWPKTPSNTVEDYLSEMK